MKKKTIALFLALALVVGCAIGGTVAWLTATTTEVKNTFTVGNVGLSLTETTGTSYKIVPGLDIAKDPMVTVTANSETCYVFVKVTEASWPTAEDEQGNLKVNYAIADGWTQLRDTDEKPVPGVYYREVTTSASAQAFAVLKDNKVTVSGSLTKTEVDAITTSPTLAFQAYAIQKANGTSTNFTPYAAWVELNPSTT